MKHTALFTCSFLLLTSSAAVPLRWTVETSRAQPATFEAYQGEALAFEAALQSAGKPLELSGIAALYWQTNGMGSAYWETTAAVNSNLLSAVWTPEMDVGARVYNCFIGIPGKVYRAAFQLRLRPSPGADPNALPLPTPVIDFAKVRVLNPPWGSGGGGVDTNAVRDIIRDEITPATNSLDQTLSDAISGKLDVSPDLELYPHAKIYWAGEYLNINGYVSMNWGLSAAAPVYATAYESGSWDSYGANGETLPTYLASGNWNTASDPFVKKSEISASNPTFSNEVATVALTVTPPPSPTLRLYDEVRKCWWIGKMVNGVLNWEVE